jgi:hypothetical protein
LNTWYITDKHIDLAGFLPRDHEVRSVLAASSVEGFFKRLCIRRADGVLSKRSVEGIILLTRDIFSVYGIYVILTSPSFVQMIAESFYIRLFCLAKA